jgi:hypothetical protein
VGAKVDRDFEKEVGSMRGHKHLLINHSDEAKEGSATGVTIMLGEHTLKEAL